MREVSSVERLEEIVSLTQLLAAPDVPALAPRAARWRNPFSGHASLARTLSETPRMLSTEGASGGTPNRSQTATWAGVGCIGRSKIRWQGECGFRALAFARSDSQGVTSRAVLRTTAAELLRPV
jgi:hypothetical protein